MKIVGYLVGVLAILPLLMSSVQAQEETYELLWSYDLRSSYGVRSISISSDGSYVAAVTVDENIYLFDRSGNLQWSSRIGAWDVSFGPNYNIYVAAGPRVHLYDISGNLLWSSIEFTSSQFGEERITAVSVSNDGKYLALGSFYDLKTYLLGPDRGVLWSYDGSRSSITDISISGDGNYVAVPSGTQVDLLDRYGNLLRSYKLDDPSIEVSLSNSGEYVAIGSREREGHTYLFDRSGNLIWSSGKGGGVSITSGANYIAATDYDDDDVYLFDRSGQMLWSYKATDRYGLFETVSLSSDGSYIAAGSRLKDSGKVYLFGRPKKGSISVSSTPSEADVYLDDVYRGTTPLTISDVSTGSHSIKITKSGYDDLSKTVTVSAGSQTRIVENLIESVYKKAEEAKATAEEHVLQSQTLLAGLTELIIVGKTIGADMSNAEEKVTNAANLLKDANESYYLALTKYNTGDYPSATTHANTAYTKGSSANDILNEAKPLVATSLRNKLNEKITRAQSLVDFANNFGIGAAYGQKVNDARENVQNMDNAINTGDFDAARNYAKSADGILSDVRTKLYSIFGGATVLLAIIVVSAATIVKKVEIRPFLGILKGRRVEKIEPKKVERKIDYSLPAIAVKGLSKSYKNAKILDNISFQLKQGELCGIVGPSGGGKSTVIESLVGRITPDAGEIKILDKSVAREREELNKLVGFVPQHPELNMDQSVWDNMINSAIKWSIEDAEEKSEKILKRIGIFDRKNIKAKNLSGGQLKRLSLGMELIREPPLLILDEPTTGLDPTSRDQILTALSKLVYTDKKTVLFTTHFMDEAEHCDEAILIGNAKMLAKGSPSELARRMPGMGKIVNLVLEEVSKDIISKISELDGVKKVIREGRVLKIIMDKPDPVEIAQKVRGFGGIVEETKISKAGMKEVFVYYTGELPEE